jgi:threo-3-hydroxy-L-aspartate ammonia-lyase
MTLVTLADVNAAAERIAADVVRTPLVPAGFGDPDRPLLLKPESLQPTGAFKLRGATNAVAQLPPSARERGVVAHSSGNHAQALAWAARVAGLPAVIVMPDSTPAVKVERTRRQGAEIVPVPAEQREAATDKIIAERGSVLVHAYEDPHVLAGHGTIGLEIAADLPDVATVLVPVSGGGLISGVAAALKSLRPSVRVVGVEPELAADLAAGFAVRRRVTWPVDLTGRTIADGLRVGAVGELAWQHILEYVDEVLTVPEAAIEDAMRRIAWDARLVAEPSGAVATAAYLQHRDRLPTGPVVAVVSGGNVDPALFGRVLAS